MIGFITIVATVCVVANGVLAQFPLPECPTNGIISLQDPNSCRRFIMCINGARVIQNCASGLEFDIVAGNCNSRQVANCNICAANPSNNLHFFLDETYCNKFIMCVGSKATPGECANGLHFNPAINACDLPQLSNCPHTPAPTVPTPPTATPTPTVPTPPTGTLPTAPTAPTVQPTPTPTLPTPPTETGPTVEPTPPTGTPPTAPTAPTVEPTPSPTVPTPAPPSTPEAECSLNQNFDLLPSSQNCSQYFVCACGHKNAQKCASGLIFDVAFGRCDSRENGAVCLTDMPPPCLPTETGTVAHRYNQHFYYLCLNGTAILKTCAPGTLFDVASKQCTARCDESSNNGSVLLRLSDRDLPSGKKTGIWWW